MPPVYFPGTSRTCARCTVERALADFDGDCTTCRSCAGRVASAAAMQAARTESEARESALDPSVDDVRALIGWGTALESEIAESFVECGGDVVRTATALGTTPSMIRARLKELSRSAARRGWSPGSDMTKATPEGFHVKGVSTYYGPEGELKGQWVKTAIDPEHRLERLFDAVKSIAEPFRGAAEPVPAAAARDKDLLAIYPLGDPHVGLYAWAQETGQDFDLQIAERELVAAADHLVEMSPPAEQALVINLGDFFHADSPENRTARSGHSLDVDTRWPKVLQVGIRIMRRIIDRSLEKHARVRVVNEIGNHDDNSAVMLSLCLAAYYEREPRVEIDTSPAKFHWYEFGKNLIGVTHGNGLKRDALPGIMACDQAEAWGRTLYRRWYCGHIHHETVKEFPGVVIESFRTLAARDAWHAASGYRSDRDLRCDIVHREWGWMSRNIIGIRQIQKSIGATPRHA